MAGSGSQSRLQTFLVPAVVAVALFLAIFDATVVTLALPAIARAMNESVIRLNLVITSYLFTLALFMPISGWIADRFGGRTVLVCAILVFVGGSIACAFSNSLATLVCARLFQGMGGALMTPVARYIMLRSVKKENLVQAMAWFTMPALLGPVLGPPVGGFIVTYYDWTWIFWLNVPIGLVGVVLVLRHVPNLPQSQRRPLDGVGFVLTGLTLAGAIVGLETVGRDPVPLWASLAFLCGGGLFGAAYARHMRRTRHPALDFTVLRDRNFRISFFGGMLFRVGVGGIGYLVALQFQETFGMTALKAGLVVFSTALGAFAMKLWVGFILRRWGFRSVLIVNALIAACAIGVLVFFQSTTPVSVLFAVLFVGGLTRSLQFTAMNTVGFVDVSENAMGAANTLYSMGQELFAVLGVVAASALLNGSVLVHGGLSEEAYLPVYLPLAALTGSSIVFFWVMDPDAGAASSGRRKTPETGS